jgi:hypothetical protein
MSIGCALSAVDDPFTALKNLTEEEARGDMAALQRGIDSSPVFVDDFYPFSWSGPSALADYFQANDAYMKKEGITDPVFDMSEKPIFEDVQESLAYLVVGGTYRYVENGMHKQYGGTLTVTMKKENGTWMLFTAAWARN